MSPTSDTADRRRTRLALLLALLVTGAGLAYILFKPIDLGGYTNQIPVTGAAVVVPPGREVCQPGEGVPADARTVSLVMAPGAAPAGPLEMRVRAGERTVMRGRPSAPPSAWVSFALPGGNPEIAEAQVCVRNRGKEPAALGGAHAPRWPNATPVLPEYGPPPVIDGQPQPGRILLQYPGPGRRPVHSYLSEIIGRAGLVKGSVVNGWTIWAALLWTCGAAGLGVWVLTRRERT